MSDLPPSAPPASAPPPAAAVAPPPPHPGLGPAGAIVLALVALLLVGAAVLGWSWSQVQSANAPAKAASAFFHQNADQGSAVAWAEASPVFRNTPLSTWDAESRQLRLGGFYSGEWDPAMVSGAQATLHGRLKLINAPDVAADVELRRTDSGWRVSWLHLWNNAAPVATADASGGTYASGSQTILPGTATPSPPATAAEPAVTPIQPVEDGSPAPAPGRPGPAGTAMPSGQVGPTCSNVFWKQGYHNDKVDCPLYLPTVPGRSEQCVVHGMDGSTRGATVTFADWDPSTNQGSYSCVLQP